MSETVACKGDNCFDHGKNTFRIETLEKRLEEYGANQVEIVKAQQEIRETLRDALASTKSAHHRLDELSALTEAIIRTAVAVENLAEKMEDVMTTLQDHDDRIGAQAKAIEDVKQAPAKALMGYVKAFITALVVGVAGWVLLWAKSKGGTP